MRFFASLRFALNDQSSGITEVRWLEAKPPAISLWYTKLHVIQSEAKNLTNNLTIVNKYCNW